MMKERGFFKGDDDDDDDDHDDDDTVFANKEGTDDIQ